MEWISSNDSLPKQGQKVLVCVEPDIYDVGIILDGHWRFDEWTPEIPNTFWTPITPPNFNNK